MFSIKPKLVIMSLLAFVMAFNAMAEGNGLETNPNQDLNIISPTEEGFSAYDKFKLKKSFNWSDCLDLKVLPGVAICPSYPFPWTVTTTYSYYDIVALVEVVGDPWRSYLYKETLVDFSSKAKDSVASSLGVSGSIGSGLSNKKSTSGKEFIGIHQYETHVWAVSDWWRLLKTGDPFDACLSLVCKTKDYKHCSKVMSSTMEMGIELKNTIASMNSDEGAAGKGQSVTIDKGNGQTETQYGDGSTYNQDGERTRDAGNYGLNGKGNSEWAETANSESFIPGMTNAELAMEGIAFAQDPEGYAKAKAAEYAMGEIEEWYEGSDLKKEVDAYYEESGLEATVNDVRQTRDEYEQALNDKKEEFKQDFDEFKNEVGETAEGVKDSIADAFDMSDAEAKPAPENSKTDNIRKQPTADECKASGGAGQSSSEDGVDGAGVNTSQVEQGGDYWKDLNGSFNCDVGDMLGNMTDMAEGLAKGISSAAFQKALAYVDFVVYFSAIEYVISYIADMAPIMVWPIFMTENHKKAATTGGFLSPLYEKFADMGAGLFMPLVCMGNSVGMAGSAAAGLLGVDLSDASALEGINEFLGARCVGSWGPLEPRVKTIGSGDAFVAAGIASIRGLQVAQNLQRLNQQNYNSLKFNLAWPHQSGCYGMGGADGLSRGWTSPASDIAKQASDVVMGGDLEDLANTASNATIGNFKKQGGYVFAYWRKRKCTYLWQCEVWWGDTGGK